MPKVMKPPSAYNPDDVLTGGDWYDGPDPDPGFYKGVVKMLMLQKAKNDEIHVMSLCEISEGKFKGAGVVKWLQLTEDGSKWFNQFLMAMTDGSPAQTKGICKAFKEIGYAVDKNEKGKVIITRIGNKFDPIGKPVAFMVKRRTIEAGPRTGETVSEISRYVVPRFGNDDTDDSSPEDVLDDEETVDDTPEVDDTEDAGLDDEPELATASTGSGDDDPWSI